MPGEHRRALVVGLDAYPSAPLAGCVNDARAVTALLERHEDGTPNFAVRTMTAPGDTVTRSSLREAVAGLFSDANDCDVALLYFSGHGTENDLGGYLVTPDARRYDEGVALAEILTLANNSRATERIIMLDSCHSGHLGAVPAVSSSLVSLSEGVSILTAARSSQYAMEAGGRGLFTELVCGALEGGASDVLGHTTTASVYAYVEQALGPWDQRPMFRSNVAKMVSVRTNRPAVELSTLRQLPGWFPTPEAHFPLSPAYEPDAKPHDADKEAIFGLLQKCRAAKLVEPVDEDHMYFAAMRNKACALTALGRHYWRLAQGGRI
jgi:hypothetical protein